MMAGAPDGSKSKPHIIIVDKEFPERNQEFDIQYVEGIPHNEYKRNGWHIRLAISVQDRTMWSAVVHSSPDLALAHRTILIRGPSRVAWLTEHVAFGKKI
jgi:hypothetical protein